MMLDELEHKSQSQITQMDGMCIINRLKLCVHMLLQKYKGISPMQVLIELNHKLISENDSIMT